MNLKERSKNSSVIKVAGGLPDKGRITNTNIDDIKETGIYYLTEGCTPSYSLVIVLTFGDVVLQFKCGDGGGGFANRTYVKGKWFNWNIH